jgi:hypothetical protein
LGNATFAARHLALLVFGCSVAVAAWPPAGTYSGSAGGRRLAVRFDARHVVAEAFDGSTLHDAGALLRDTAITGPTSSFSFFPAGLVVQRLSGTAASVRVTAPIALAVATAGVAWLAMLLIGGGGLTAPRWVSEGRTSARFMVTLPMRRRRSLSWVWRLRYAAGAAAVVAVWWCVYAMPRDVCGGLYSETQALHVAGASFGVALATILITFD